MPFGTGRPLWVEDASFRLDYHVRHTALPAPGGDEELIGAGQPDRRPAARPHQAVVGDVARRGPGRRAQWAVIKKTHHAMIDGVSGVDLLTVLFDLEQDTTPRPRRRRGGPPAPPGTVGLLTGGVRGLARNVGRADCARRRAGGAAEARRRGARRGGRGAGRDREAADRRRPDTPLNAKPGPHRRVAVVTHRSWRTTRWSRRRPGGHGERRRARRCRGRARALPGRRGDGLTGKQLRACVPVSLRPEEKRARWATRSPS